MTLHFRVVTSASNDAAGARDSRQHHTPDVIKAIKPNTEKFAKKL
jgi:hypothetical protein